jgi:WD repeat-containing protein 19
LGLASHTFLENYKFENDSQEGHLRYFFQNLSLKRFSNALVAAKFLNIYNVYEGLARKALENLDLDIALKTFQMGKNLSMVLTIQSFIHENEKNLLIGNIAMVLGKYDIAQEYYLKSTEPLNALDMRCDIQDWFIASSLAKSIAPHQESFIAKRLAIQTESQGNNSEALKLYERSVLRDDEKMIEKSVIITHNVQCFAGMARTSIKLGDIQRGFNIAR